MTTEYEQYQQLIKHLYQLNTDISTLSKKTPDAPINKFKLGIINEKLSLANGLLPEEYRPINDFTIFDIDELPSNSDVVIVLSLYLKSLRLWYDSKY